MTSCSCTELNGAPLPPDMGQPVRLIYPGHYGYKYVKWVERVEADQRKRHAVHRLLGRLWIPRRRNHPRCRQ